MIKKTKALYLCNCKQYNGLASILLFVLLLFSNLIIMTMSNSTYKTLYRYIFNQFQILIETSISGQFLS